MFHAKSGKMFAIDTFHLKFARTIEKLAEKSTNLSGFIQKPAHVLLLCVSFSHNAIVIDHVFWIFSPEMFKHAELSIKYEHELIFFSYQSKTTENAIQFVYAG